MTQAEYNKKLQTVQEIELAVGFKILTLRTYYDRDRLVEASWASPRGTVFRQTLPFTDQTTYYVDEHLYGDIVYRSPWE